MRLNRLEPLNRVCHLTVATSCVSCSQQRRGCSCGSTHGMVAAIHCRGKGLSRSLCYASFFTFFRVAVGHVLQCSTFTCTLILHGCEVHWQLVDVCVCACTSCDCGPAEDAIQQHNKLDHLAPTVA
eukprot:3171333-Amphidinium_carterae.1